MFSVNILQISMIKFIIWLGALLACLLAGCDSSGGVKTKHARESSQGASGASSGSSGSVDSLTDNLASPEQREKRFLKRASSPGRSKKANGREIIDASRVREYNSELAKLRSSDRATKTSKNGGKNEYCDVSSLRLKEGDVKFQKKVYAEGSGSRLFVEDSRGKKLVVKTVRVDSSPGIRDGLNRERALLHALRGTGVAPEAYEIKDGLKNAVCHRRSMVSEYVGAKEIRLAGALLSKNRALLGKVGAKMIELIKALHATGFIHGDIFGRNLVYGSDSDIVRTLRLIDFGRSEPFIQETTGEHIEEKKIDYGWAWKHRALSIWELQGWRKTRRDDMYRIAELLISLGGFGGKFERELALLAGKYGTARLKSDEWRRGKEQLKEKVLKLKLNRVIGNGAPREIVEFYEYCKGLKFAEAPDYDFWINKLRSIT